MVELSQYVPINLICLAVLGALGLRKVIRMEGYHWPRVVLLTGLLWVPVLYLFLICYPPSPPSCVIQFGEPGLYPATEY